MDTTLTVGGGTTLGAAETATPEPLTGTESAASETKETNASGEQSTAEGGQEQAGSGRKRWSIQDEVKELRAQRRELREQLSSSEQMREELRQLREDLNRQRQPGTAKTPANFWQDPEARLQSLRDEIRDEIGEQNRGLMDAFHQTREQEYAQQQLRQEQASAAEFIRSQKGYDPSDDEDLIEIIESLPNRQHLSPQWVADYAWLKLQAQRGVGDRSLAKQRASGVQGQPPGTGFGRKIWTKAEYDATLDQIEKTPTNPKWNELIAELESANKEGRVR
jgi:hypothetical protein